VSRRTIVWIVLGAVIFHLGLFLLLGRMRALPKTRQVPPPNFGYKEEVYDNPKTGERTIYREIRVSTKLADPKKLPPPPVYPEKKSGQ
jgi:hypothetical protein